MLGRHRNRTSHTLKTPALLKVWRQKQKRGQNTERRRGRHRQLSFENRACRFHLLLSAANVNQKLPYNETSKTTLHHEPPYQQPSCPNSMGIYSHYIRATNGQGLQSYSRNLQSPTELMIFLLLLKTCFRVLAAILLLAAICVVVFVTTDKENQEKDQDPHHFI